MVNVRLVLLAGMGAVLAATVACSSASGTPIIIENGHSWARIDPYSQLGNDIWVVDGWNFLVKEWFWYRVDGPGGLGREASIDTLDPSPLVLPSDTSGDGVPDNLRLVYRSADQGLAVEVNYNLLGAPPGSGRTDMAQTVAVTNTASAARAFHLFLYADYILSDGFDTAVATWPNTVFQEFAPWNYAQAAVVPVPSHVEVNLEPLTLDALNDALPTTLNGAAPPDGQRRVGDAVGLHAGPRHVLPHQREPSADGRARAGDAGPAGPGWGSGPGPAQGGIGDAGKGE